MGEPADSQRIPDDENEDNHRRQESGPYSREDEKGDQRGDNGGPGQREKHVDPAAEAWSRNPNLSPPIHLARPE